jgi:membrane-associated phospholipid phosphatase
MLRRRGKVVKNRLSRPKTEFSQRTERAFLKPRAFAIGLVCLLSFSFRSLAFGFSQTNDNQEKPAKILAVDRLNKAYFRQVSQDFISLITAPRHWQGPDIMNLAAVFGTGTVLFTLDRDIFNWVAERRSAFSQDLSPWITKAGDGGWLLGFCGAVYGLGEMLKRPDWRRAALLSVESLAISSLSVATMKFIAGRARPHAWEGSQSFHPFSTSSRYTSFPSGHASAAFSVATAIAGQSESQAIDILAYSLATLVALARVHDEAHWASDVLAGSALGYFIARGVVHLHRQDKKKVSVLISPIRGGMALAVNLSLD